MTLLQCSYLFRLRVSADAPDPADLRVETTPQLPIICLNEVSGSVAGQLSPWAFSL